MLAAQHELERSAGSEHEVDLEFLKLLGEDLEGEDLAGPLPEQPEDVPEGPGVLRCLDQSPRGAPHKESIYPQTRLIGFTTHAYLFKRLALLRSPHTPPLA